MIRLNTYNSNSINTLFSSLNNRSGSSVFTNIDLSTYNSIKTGSYGKLCRSYYSKGTDNTGKVSSSVDTFKKYTEDSSSSVDTSKKKLNAAEVKNNSYELTQSASALRKESLWKKQAVTDSNGNISEEIDKDAVYKAVDQFVKDYNSVIKSAGDSEDNKVLKNASNIVSATKYNEKALNNIGITLNEDNTLSISEDKFKQASMVNVKNMFSGTGSYGQTVQMDSSAVYSSSVSQLANLESGALYSSTGSYSYVSGSTYNNYL